MMSCTGWLRLALACRSKFAARKFCFLLSPSDKLEKVFIVAMGRRMPVAIRPEMMGPLD